MPGHDIVNNSDRRGGQVIPVREEAAQTEWELHDAFIAGSNQVEERRPDFVLRRLGFTARPTGYLVISLGKRHHRCDRG